MAISRSEYEGLSSAEKEQYFWNGYENGYSRRGSAEEGDYNATRQQADERYRPNRNGLQSTTIDGEESFLGTDGKYYNASNSTRDERARAGVWITHDGKAFRSKDEAERYVSDNPKRSGTEMAEDEALGLWQGMSTPGLEQLQLSQSALAGTEADPQAIAAQRAAMEQLGQISRSGFTVEDQARMEQLQQMGRGNQQAIQGNLAARGMAGSGLEAMARQVAQQGAAQQAVGVQALGAQRSRQATDALGQLGGQMRGQSFQEEATRRGAQDSLDRFNAGMVQQDFANRMGLTGAQSGAYRNWAAAERGQQAQSSAQDAAMWQAILGGAGTVAGSLFGPGGAAVGGTLGGASGRAVSSIDEDD